MHIFGSLTSMFDLTNDTDHYDYDEADMVGVSVSIPPDQYHLLPLITPTDRTLSTEIARAYGVEVQG